MTLDSHRWTQGKMTENEMFSKGWWLDILLVMSRQIATSISSFPGIKSQKILDKDEAELYDPKQVTSPSCFLPKNARLSEDTRAEAEDHIKVYSSDQIITKMKRGLCPSFCTQADGWK